MLMADCKGCIHRLWMVGIGQGVRCKHEDNQQYRKVNNLPVIISYVPECTYYELRKETK